MAPFRRGRRHHAPFLCCSCAVRKWTDAVIVPRPPRSSRWLGHLHLPVSLLCLELFCATANLTQALGANSYRAIGVDRKYRVRRATGQNLLLDLTGAECPRKFFDVVSHLDQFYVHLAPPCGSSSRARERRLPKRAIDAAVSVPARCRSDEFP